MDGTPAFLRRRPSPAATTEPARLDPFQWRAEIRTGLLKCEDANTVIQFQVATTKPARTKVSAEAWRQAEIPVTERFVALGANLMAAE